MAAAKRHGMSTMDLLASPLFEWLLATAWVDASVESARSKY